VIDLDSKNQALAQVRIVLVEPAGPRNVGSIARVMKNMGLSQLVLVNPKCDPRGDESRQMAVHAQDILDQATQVTTLAEALVGCFRAIATTARKRYRNVEPEAPRTALPWLLEQASALIFGREDKGLNNQEIELAQRLVTLPVNPNYASLNLAQAVGICCYELRSALVTATAPVDPLPESQRWNDPTEVPLADLEGYFQHLELTLLNIGYLQPHTANSRMQKFRQIYKRSQLSASELALLRGVLRQTDWAAHPDSQS
jgi:tRNA/rRNA methyltransferase